MRLFVPEPPNPYHIQTDMKLFKVGGGQENGGAGGGEASYLGFQAFCLLQELGLEGSGFLHLFQLYGVYIGREEGRIMNVNQ